ncbi:hypothetical protein [Actinosynnema sp. NPDC023587]|uniref:hypothetical protein n=1 Tax=Actinosynnema sp. NPDC023587 TaxID=3154695 RepID=UPI003411B46B
MGSDELLSHPMPDPTAPVAPRVRAGPRRAGTTARCGTVPAGRGGAEFGRASEVDLTGTGSRVWVKLLSRGHSWSTPAVAPDGPARVRGPVAEGLSTVPVRW